MRPPCSGNCQGDRVRQERSQLLMRSLFIIVHQPRVAGHVCCQYRRQPALDPDWPFLLHGPQIQHTLVVRRIGRRGQTTFAASPFGQCLFVVRQGSFIREGSAGRARRHLSTYFWPSTARRAILIDRFNADIFGTALADVEAKSMAYCICLSHQCLRATCCSMVFRLDQHRGRSGLNL